MSYQNQQLGGQAFNHGPSSSAETEYDRLRSLAREEQGKHQHFAAQASQAYSSGDGAGAHNASEQSEQHAAAADNYNKQASEFIFRENNAVGKVAADTIDLHGQYVEEAEEILEQRIRYAQSTGQTHLHVIVGKGNHSPGHIQKIKPKVEALCQELGLQYSTEHNEGRMFIQLQPGAGGGGGGQQQQQGGGQQQMPGYDYQQHYQPQHQNYGQPLYQSAYPMGGSPNYSYAQAAAGGYPGAGQQQQQQMQYGGQQQQQQQNGGYPGKPQQQFDASQQQGQQDEGVKCCGIKICVVM